MTPRTVACQAPLSMGFSQQEYRSGLPFPPPGDLPDPGTEPPSPAWQADSLPPSHWEASGVVTAGQTPEAAPGHATDPSGSNCSHLPA